MACAAGLRHEPVRVTLIDRENYHLFQPLLYQVATAALSPADMTTPVRAAFRDNARMRCAARHGYRGGRRCAPGDC
jgi:NADH dehydrogenase/putative oxidoreductase